jgi:hypothetical protein
MHLIEFSEGGDRICPLTRPSPARCPHWRPIAPARECCKVAIAITSDDAAL